MKMVYDSGMNKYDLFWHCNDLVGNVVEEVDKTFGKWGQFTIDSADFILRVNEVENVSPELLAVTWMNETTFRFYSEPNPNKKSNPNDDFDKYDVGPFQLNVGTLKANVANKYLSIKGLDINKILGTKGKAFNGDPFEHSLCAARFLNRIGQGEIVGGKEREIMFTKLTQEQWSKLNLDAKNGRRAIAYTGPEARPYRMESWKKFGPMFKRFFDVYKLGI
jgi:hypothetical protein